MSQRDLKELRLYESMATRYRGMQIEDTDRAIIIRFMFGRPIRKRKKTKPKKGD
jgi:hypothetical protein